MARAQRTGSARIRPWSGAPAGYRSFKPFKSSFAAAEPAYTRRQTASEHTISPSSLAARDAAKLAEKSKLHEDELAQLRSSVTIFILDPVCIAYTG